MYRLSDQQIDFILNDIGARGVEMESLQQNLLDHICCIIEQNLEPGGDFEGFYASTVKTFYKHGLWEIEEETIRVLTFKNYYIMKKSMIVSGTFSVATFIVGCFFKIMHWPGASLLLLLGIVSMAFIFLPLMFLFKRKEATSKRDRLITSIGTLLGIMLCLCVLFAIMHWPGRTPLWLSATGLSVFVLIPVYFFTGIRQPETRTNTIITTIILVGATCLQFTMLALKPVPRVETAQYQACRDLDNSYRDVAMQNARHFQHADSIPKLKALREKSDALCAEIEQLKLSLVDAVESKQEKTVDYDHLSTEYFSNYDLPTALLFADGRPGAPVFRLRSRLDDFNAYVKNNCSEQGFGMLNTANAVAMNSEGLPVHWENVHFYQVPYGMALRNLVQLQLDVRLAEANCIR